MSQKGLIYMNIPRINTATARNIAIAIGLATTVSCATPCNCKNKDNKEFNNIEKVAQKQIYQAKRLINFNHF